MALTLKSEFSISLDGSRIYVTDKTGLYDATDNPGGWGTPNQNLGQSCLMCLVVRKDSEGDEYLQAISPSTPYVYDNTATNSDEKSFEFLFTMDSVINIYLIRIPVSLDDATILDTAAPIADGDYYYYDGSIYLRTLGAGVLVEDYSVLIEEDSLLQGLCETLTTPMLALKFQELRKDYRIKRDTQCDDAEDLFNEISKLRLDIEGIYYTFYSQLYVEAQNQIEELVDKYALDVNSI